MISIKNAAQIEKMRAAGKLLHDVLAALRTQIHPGVTTKQLDAYAHKMITQAGAIPSFLGYQGFPASLCASRNDVVVHGIPDDTPLQEGDILGIDCGVILDGWQSDSAFTAGVGQVSPEAQQLMDVTEQCFWKGIEKARPGARLSDIGHAVQTHARSYGYQPIRALCGHGIGRHMHEDPEVFNFGPPGRGVRLQPGMTLAVEPMIAAGDWDVVIDGWHVVTRDHSLCSHYEHTIVITEDQPEILSLPGKWPEDAP